MTVFLVGCSSKEATLEAAPKSTDGTTTANTAPAAPSAVKKDQPGASSATPGLAPGYDMGIGSKAK